MLIVVKKFSFDHPVCIIVCNANEKISVVRPIFKSKKPHNIRSLLVSTYVVCERLSVKQVLAGVVEILVQKSQFTLNWGLVPVYNTPLKIEI